MLFLFFFLLFLLSCSCTPDPYTVLGISNHASAKEIKEAFKRQARIYHPDKNPQADQSTMSSKMAEINAAYDVLSDENKRKVFDRTGKVGGEEDRYREQQHVDPFFGQFFGSNNNGFFKGEEESASESVPIYSFNFEHLVEKDSMNVWMIEVVAQWCHVCKRIAPVWEDFILKTKGMVRVGRISHDADPGFTQKLNVRTVPHIFASFKGKLVSLNAKNSYENLNVDMLMEFAGTQFENAPVVYSVNQLDAFFSNVPTRMKVLLIATKKAIPFIFKSVAHKNRGIIVLLTACYSRYWH